MLEINEIDGDRRNPDFGYIHYSVAKAHGIRRGSEFEVEDLGRFVAEIYVDWRPDINRRFSGFRVQEINVHGKPN